jgi:hypothetical protein
MREEAEETESRCVEMADRALPIQEHHLTPVCDGSLELAAEEDPAS